MYIMKSKYSKPLFFIILVILTGIESRRGNILEAISSNIIPIIIGLVLLYKNIKNQHEPVQDEKETLINMKAGSATFWVCVGYVFLISFLHDLISPAFYQITDNFLLYMCIIYYLFLILFKKFDVKK